MGRTAPVAGGLAGVLPRCVRTPTEADLRGFALLQTATAAQARALGLVLRTPSGAAEPFLSGQVVLWRAGRLAECETGNGQTLVQGGEWIAGFLLRTGGQVVPRSLTELSAALRRGDVLEFGWQLNGVAGEGGLQAQLQHLASAFQRGDGLAAGELRALVARWPAARVQADPATSVGRAAPFPSPR